MSEGNLSPTKTQGQDNTTTIPTNPTQKLEITTIIDMMATNVAISDLHISADDYIAYRINGDIVKQIQFGKISNDFMELFLKHLVKSDTDKVAKFRSEKDMDFAYVAKNGMSYRVNAFMKLGKIAIVMRKINAEARKLESLMYEDIAASLTNSILSRKTGLFLVT
jgi:Tfp pilus assembly pilus retraction ATPase PilT